VRSEEVMRVLRPTQMACNESAVKIPRADIKRVWDVRRVWITPGKVRKKRCTMRKYKYE
jgi:hypothetical protein